MHSVYSTGIPCDSVKSLCNFLLSGKYNLLPVIVNDNNKWSRNFDERPHRREQFFFTKGGGGNAM